MTVATFDTHAAVKALTGAGFNAKQAETITDTVRDAVTEGGATKADIAGVEAKSTALEIRLYRTLLAMTAVLVAAMAAFTKL